MQGTCSLLSAKISYNKNEGISFKDQWRNICQKRDECDERIKKMKGVAFFFSSIATLETRTKEKSEKANNEKEDEEYDEQNDEVQEKHWPAMTYWIAVQSSNGMRVSTVPLHSTLLQTGMEVTAKALPVCKRGKEKQSCAPLCTTLTDHNNNFMQSKVDMSFSNSLELLQDQLLEEPLESIHASERFVRLQVVSRTFIAKLRDKLIPSLVSASNDHFKETIIKHLNKLVEILGDRESDFIKQMRINYDLIEVNGVFQLARESLYQIPSKNLILAKNLRGRSSSTNTLKSQIQNSLSQLEIAHFCEYFIRVFNCRIKQHKEKVMCLIGEPNSGKTSLFTPISHLIPARYIAMISKQEAFNKSLIDENTQLLFLDQAQAKLMDPEDWKILTQGGLTAHDRKYKTSSMAVIRCPMFITCQTDMDFGAEHNTAMDAR